MEEAAVAAIWAPFFFRVTILPRGEFHVEKIRTGTAQSSQVHFQAAVQSGEATAVKRYSKGVDLS